MRSCTYPVGTRINGMTEEQMKEYQKKYPKEAHLLEYYCRGNYVGIKESNIYCLKELEQKIYDFLNGGK